jgi:hypothetical protein
VIGALSIVLLLSAALCCAGDVTDSAARMAEVLFPSTTGWIQLQETPKLSEDVLAQIRERLRATYLSSHAERSLGNWDCPTVDGMLQASYIGYFHTFDVDTDGYAEIVYSGPSHCVEGDLTIIWFGSKDESIESRRLVRWGVRVLSIAPGREPQVTAVAVGCCADPIDEYSIGTLANVRQRGVVRTTKNTRAPSGALTSPLPFTNRGETVLRSTPELKSEYDPDQSELMDTAVFGNVLCSYIGGASGEIRAEERDAQGKPWAYVVMDRGSNRLRHDAPFDVTVGWVDRATIHEVKSRSRTPDGP